MVNDEVIESIRRNNDIVDVIGEYLSLTPKGKNYFAVCPFHDDHSPSMSISPDKQIFTCFTCHKAGNVITFLRDYLDITYMDAVKKLADRAGIEINYKGKSVNKFKENHKADYEIYDMSKKYYKNNLNTKYGVEAKKYLEKRGLNKEIIDKFDIGLSLNETDGLIKSLSNKYDVEKLVSLGLASETNGKSYDLYKNRIMFPLKDLDGNVVGFSGRIYLEGQDGNKYVNSKESAIFKKSKLLYNYDNAKESIRHKKEIIICEGFMDAIRLYSIGIGNVVALMGTSFTDDHLSTIKKLNVSVTLSLDNDDAGRNATISIGNTLEENNISTSVIVFDKYKDVDEYVLNRSSEDFIRCYNNKVSFIDFKLDTLKKNKDLKDSKDLSVYINEAIKAIDLIEDDILKELKIKELSNTYDLSEEIIRSKLSKKSDKKEQNFIKSTTKSQKMRYNKYQVSELRIIYLMLNYPQEVIRIYEKKLGHLINPNMKRLANEIVYYKDSHGGFDYAGFLGYIADIPELLSAYNEVISYKQIDGYTLTEIDDYIDTIQEGSYKIEIERLKEKMKNTLDINEKKSIALKIEKMKKEVLKW